MAIIGALTPWPPLPQSGRGGTQSEDVVPSAWGGAAPSRRGLAPAARALLLGAPASCRLFLKLGLQPAGSRRSQPPLLGRLLALVALVVMGSALSLAAQAPAPSKQPAKPPAKPASAVPAKPTAAKAAPAAASSGDWTMFRGDAALTGRASSDLPRELKPLWTFQAEKGFAAAAAIAGNTVYVTNLDGHLYALDLATGKQRWKLKATDEIKSAPSVSAGVVYFGDEKGLFHAVDAVTGKPRWTFKTGAGVISSANFAAGCILVGSYDQNLYCLSPKDGKPVWQVETEGYVHATPAVIGATSDRVVVSGCDGYLRVLRTKDGQELAKLPLGGYTAASTAISGNRAFVGHFENRFVAIDLPPSGAPKIAWEYEHPVRKFPYYGSAAVNDKIVVVGGRDKLVHGLDPATGKALWTHNNRAAVDASPVLVGTDRVVSADKSGEIVQLDTRTGKPVWRFDAGSPIEASPAVGRGRLVVGTIDGTLYCFGA
jgi:eukaryotic-like serine/threonine-protein kinase